MLLPPGGDDGREENDGQAVISDEQRLSPQGLLQWQTASPKVCEGVTSQLLPTCSCQTVQPALLPVNLTYLDDFLLPLFFIYFVLIYCSLFFFTIHFAAVIMSISLTNKGISYLILSYLIISLKLMQDTKSYGPAIISWQPLIESAHHISHL